MMVLRLNNNVYRFEIEIVNTAKKYFQKCAVFDRLEKVVPTIIL